MFVSEAGTAEHVRTEVHSTPEIVSDDDYSSFTPKRRWPLVLSGVLIGAVGALVAQQLLTGSNNEVVASAEAVELALVEVMSTDLTEEVQWSGELAYGSEVSINGGGGVITSVTPVGTIVSQGDILVEEDRLARTVFYGSIPPYRTMAVDDEGPDVLQLEENLVALGYDTAEQLSVDGVFSGYTETLVMRWQLAMGAEETGVVTPEAIAVLAGPSIVRTTPVVGSQASGPIVTVAASRRTCGSPCRLRWPMLTNGRLGRAQRWSWLTVHYSPLRLKMSAPSLQLITTAPRLMSSCASLGIAGMFRKGR